MRVLLTTYYAHAARVAHAALELLTGLEQWATDYLPAIRALLADALPRVRSAAVNCVASLIEFGKAIPHMEAETCLASVAALTADADASVVRVAQSRAAELETTIRHKNEMEEVTRRRADRAAEKERAKAGTVAAASASEDERARGHSAQMAQMQELDASNRAATEGHAQGHAARKAALLAPLSGDDEAVQRHRQRKAELKEQIARNLKANRTLVKAFGDEEELGRTLLGLESSYGAELDALFEARSSDEDEGGA